jgi:hypothetical protein
MLIENGPGRQIMDCLEPLGQRQPSLCSISTDFALRLAILDETSGNLPTTSTPPSTSANNPFNAGKMHVFQAFVSGACLRRRHGLRNLIPLPVK